MGRMGVSEFYFGSPSFFCALPNASHRIFTLFGAHFPHASPPLSSQNVQVLNPLLSCLFVMHIIWYLMFWRLLYRCSTNRKPTLRSSCICVYIYIHICMYIYVYMCIYGTPPVPPPPCVHRISSCLVRALGENGARPVWRCGPTHGEETKKTLTTHFRQMQTPLSLCITGC